MKALAKLKNNITIGSILMFGMGMFSTMPIVCAKLGGRYISFFTVFFVLGLIFFAVNCVLYGGVDSLGKNVRLIFAWFIMAAISSCIGWLYFRGKTEWQNASLGYLPKIVMYFAFALLWNCQRNCRNYTKYLLKGLLVGCILNLIWAIIDAVGFYLFGASVNNIVFKQYAIDNGVRFETVSLIRNGMIRASGFNADPAHIGFIAPAMAAYAIYKKNGKIFILSIAGVIGSASTTALVCTLIVAVFGLSRLISMLSHMNFFRTMIVIIIVLFALLLVPGGYAKIGTVIGKFFERIVDVYGRSGGGGERLIYLLQFPKALISSGFMSLFGTGFGTASYAYTFNPEILQLLGPLYKFPYDMEMTYISYIFDLGIFGFAVYMTIIYRILKNYKNDTNEEGMIIRGLCVGMVLSALFYHYTFMAMQVLLLIVGMVHLDRKKYYFRRFDERTELLVQVELEVAR